MIVVVRLSSVAVVVVMVVVECLVVEYRWVLQR
jgi:hypothetical protein